LTDPGFAITTSQEDGAALVTVHGEVDLYTGPLLWERVSALIADGWTRVVLDLEEMDFIDSTGLSVLVMGMRRLQELGGELVLRSPCHMASKLFELTGLAQLLEIEGGEAALAV
jgi:anti-sigma B factor antagonist